jgi:hypothetical protein
VIRRREFVTLLGGAAAWPLAARAQVLPAIGLLRSSPGAVSHVVTAFRQGLAEAGFVEGRTLLSSYGSRTTSCIGYQNWPPIWSVGRSP